jgi:type I restriction enzyme S subunit
MSDLWNPEWETKRIGELCDVIDPHPSHRAPEEKQDGIFFLGIGDLSEDGQIIGSKARRVSPDIFLEHQQYYQITGNTIGFCRVASVGKVIEFKEKYPEAITISPTLAIIEPRDIEKKFLAYCLRSRGISEQVASLSSGSTRESLGIKILRDLIIPIPPLPEQKKIAENLSGIDNLVRSLTEHNQKLETTKAALSKELISGQSGHRKESPYGQIPEHWNESTLGGVIGIANLQTGPFGSQLHAHEYTSEGIPVVMPQDMRNCCVVTDKIARITPDRAKTLEKHRVSPRDILFSRRGDIGRHAIISTNESGWICGTGCLRARTDGAINPIFLSELLRHRYALEWLNANAVGQTMLNLNTGILAALPVVVPPVDEQEKIANSLSSINEQSRKIANKIWHTQNLKAAISSDLLCGCKRVSI